MDGRGSHCPGCKAIKKKNFIREETANSAHKRNFHGIHESADIIKLRAEGRVFGQGVRQQVNREGREEWFFHADVVDDVRNELATLKKQQSKEAGWISANNFPRLREAGITASGGTVSRAMRDMHKDHSKNVRLVKGKRSGKPVWQVHPRGLEQLKEKITPDNKKSPGAESSDEKVLYTIETIANNIDKEPAEVRVLIQSVRKVLRDAFEPLLGTDGTRQKIEQDYFIPSSGGIRITELGLEEIHTYLYEKEMERNASSWVGRVGGSDETREADVIDR